MDHSVEYKKTCPYDGKVFIAHHLSQKYCDQTCKKRMFRKKQQNKRERKNEDREALELNDLRLDELFIKSKPNYTKADLDGVKFNHKCYDRKFKIQNYIIYIIKDYLLLELPERVLNIYKCF